MAIDVSLHHLTEYSYDRPINLGSQIIRLRPAPHFRNTIRSYSLNVLPKKYFINWQQDAFGNYLARLDFREKVNYLKIEVGITTDIRVFNPFEFFLDKECEKYPITYPEQLKKQLAPYLHINDQSSEILNFIEGVDQRPRKVIDFLVDLNNKIYQKLKYLIRLEPGVQSPQETLVKNCGSCRDYAWLLCQALRHLGFASRFVSGYIIQLKPDAKSVDGPSGTDKDFTDLHAWAEVYLSGAGWIGLDATSGLLAGEGHIPLVCTPQPSDAAPITGEIEPCESKLNHQMTVTRLNQDRRITNPCTDAEWSLINKLGHHVDARLQKDEVGLTMGGEPTFVPIDNIESESWTNEATNDQKLIQSDKLLRKLKEQLAPQGLTHCGQGKWYPGEELPRWSLNCFFRNDQEPMCKDTDWLATLVDNHNYELNDASNLIKELSPTLGLGQSYIIPAYNPGDDDACGYVLPLTFSNKHKRWISSPWNFAEKKLFLIQGDSALGYRLPLSALADNSEGESETWPKRDPFAQVDAFESYKDLCDKAESRAKTCFEPLPKSTQEDAYVRTALCVEIRNARLYVFMPPLNYMEHFLDLVASLEQTARSCKLKLILEGYTPPADNRISKFSITPDPGVIEVNSLPTKNWPELCAFTQTLFKETHALKLSTSRFFIDGRRVGTGGGNHIVLGGQSPKDSPFLKRPDLLRSMITFWQHHPSLSYLFSSEFIGPTSQSPRVDEARNDSLYELEIAFTQLEQQKTTPAWLVDRLFRNLLVDATGNTHRSEFCVDKMYSPQGSMGRLGLLEMRGFEMPPHERMALLQALLVRACVASFYKKPYHHKLIRWGTRLHDKFLLPYFIWQDFLDVLGYLRADSLDFDPIWFKAFNDFRFPTWGTKQVNDISLEIKHALEPWHVLGEDIYQNNVSRAVDSSVEKIQVRVNGFNERYQLLCNGYQVPLKQTSKNSEYVAGIRFKAWQPPSCLHPTIKPHAPLVFDIVDKANMISQGGCTYNVVHPGGANYEGVPINENEAEARTRSRFDSKGFTPGVLRVKETKLSNDFPHTLDLRMQ